MKKIHPGPRNPLSLVALSAVLGMACLGTTGALAQSTLSIAFGTAVSPSSPPNYVNINGGANLKLSDGTVTAVESPLVGGAADPKELMGLLEDSWVMSTGGIFYSINNLPSGTYDFDIYGAGGPEGFGQTSFESYISSGGNNYDSGANNTHLSGVEVVAGQPVSITVLGYPAYVYLSSVMIAYPSSGIDPVAIVTQPATQTVTQGDPVTFTVSATGSAPLIYQWSHDGVQITDATNSTYTINATQSGDAGSYTVFVANGVSSVTSSGASLTIDPSCAAPASYPTISLSHEANDGSAYDSAHRRIWALNAAQFGGACIVSTESNSELFFDGMVDDAIPNSNTALGTFSAVAAPNINTMLVHSRAVDDMSRLVFYDLNDYSHDEVDIWLEDRFPYFMVGYGRNCLAYSQNRKTAYITGALKEQDYPYFYGPLDGLATIDCQGGIGIVTSLVSLNTSNSFGSCVFAENADKLVIENGNPGGTGPAFWYYSPGTGQLTASQAVPDPLGLNRVGIANSEPFYVPELNVLIVCVGINPSYGVYVIDPDTDTVITQLYGFEPRGVCYNTCTGKLFVSTSDNHLTCYDPANGYSLVSDVGVGEQGRLYYDPYSNLIYLSPANRAPATSSIYTH